MPCAIGQALASGEPNREVTASRTCWSKVAHVGFDGGRARLGVTTAEQVEDLDVLVDGVPGVGDVGEVHVPDTVAVCVEVVKGVGEEPVAGCVPDDLVAAAVDSEQVLGRDAGAQ